MIPLNLKATPAPPPPPPATSTTAPGAAPKTQQGEQVVDIVIKKWYIRIAVTAAVLIIASLIWSTINAWSAMTAAVSKNVFGWDYATVPGSISAVIILTFITMLLGSAIISVFVHVV